MIASFHQGSAYFELGEYSLGAKALENATDRFRSLAESHPASDELRMDLAITLGELGRSYTASGQIPEARMAFREAVSSLDSLSESEKFSAQASQIKEKVNKNVKALVSGQI